MKISVRPDSWHYRIYSFGRSTYERGRISICSYFFNIALSILVACAVLVIVLASIIILSYVLADLAAWIVMSILYVTILEPSHLISILLLLGGVIGVSLLLAVLCNAFLNLGLACGTVQVIHKRD